MNIKNILLVCVVVLAGCSNPVSATVEIKSAEIKKTPSRFERLKNKIRRITKSDASDEYCHYGGMSLMVITIALLATATCLLKAQKRELLEHVKKMTDTRQEQFATMERSNRTILEWLRQWGNQ